MEGWTGKEITDEALDEAIEVINKSRRGIPQICDVRREKDPHTAGLEAIATVVSQR